MADKQALYFPSPEMPTPENFDELFKKFGSTAFSAEPESWTLDSDAPNPSDANETYRYEVHNYLVQLVLNCFIKDQASIVCICL